MKLSRRLAVAGAVLAGTVVAAQAADMPLKAPPIVAVPFSWTGAYVGVNLGAVRGNANYDAICPGAITAACPVLIPGTLQIIPGIGLLVIPAAFSGLPGGSARDTTFMGGVQAGYNWQVNQIVLGVEGDHRRHPYPCQLDARRDPPPAPDFARRRERRRRPTPSTGSPRRGRAPAWSFPERGLLYVTGGAAFTNAKVEHVLWRDVWAARGASVLSASGRREQLAWACRLDASAAASNGRFSKAWSLAAEYRHNDFGSQNYLLGTDVAPGNPIMDRVKFTTDQVTLRVNWRFTAH